MVVPCGGMRSEAVYGVAVDGMDTACNMHNVPILVKNENSGKSMTLKNK
jgi:hypothetical protein